MISVAANNLLMFSMPVEKLGKGSWRPIAGTGVGYPPSSPMQMMEDFHAGRWGKPSTPSDLAIPELEPLAIVVDGTQQQCLFECLPLDTLMHILIRLSRVHQPALVCVCKLWRAIVRNGDFVVARRKGGFAEPFIVAVAGEDEQRTAHNKVSMLHGNKWLKLAALPHPTGHHCAVVCNEEIYVLGGHHVPRMMMFNPEPCSCVMVYSPPRNMWRATNIVTKARSMPGIAACGGKVYVFGGMDTTFKIGHWAGSYKDMSHVEVHDPATHRWDARLAPMPLKCNTARAVTIEASSTIYLMGGELDIADDPHKFGVVQVYDVAKDEWRLLETEMPIAGGACFAVGANIYVLGGSTSGRRPPLSVPSLAQMREDGELDDPNDGTGEELTGEGEPKGFAYAFDFDAAETAESWCLDTTSGVWTQLASAPKTHSGLALYLDGERIRAADDPSLNYNIKSNAWEADPQRQPLKKHLWAAEILCAPLPF